MKVRCTEECEGGLRDCPACSGQGEVLIRYRPVSRHADCPEDGCRPESCEECEGGKVRCAAECEDGLVEEEAVDCCQWLPFACEWCSSAPQALPEVVR